MSLPTPPRPPGAGRPGTGVHPKPPPERSISPAPMAKRPGELAIPSLQPPTPDPAAVREAALQAEIDRLRDEVDRKSREPALPSPRADLARQVWPPTSTPAPPGGRISIDYAEPDSGPRSARERAGAALRGARQPLIVTLLSTVLSGGGVTAILTARGQVPPTPDPTAAAGYALLKSEVERLAGVVSRQAEQQAQFQGWVLGYLRATGARVEAAPGAPSPTVVEIRALPAPTAKVAPVLAAPKRGGLPQPASLDVLTPPPPALPPPKAPDLPERLTP